jgi:signal transduction histidine kinase
MAKAEDRTPAPTSGHVLVVEDQPYDRDLLVRVLRSDGHRVTTAATGAEGLSQLDRANPHVVLCDVVMPEMSGLDFCRAVKGREGRPFVPVLLVTGRTDREDILAGFEAGADDYIAKPIDFAELKARVRTMVRIRHLQAQLESQSYKLQEANRDMEEFLHAVSHDLRAPVISLTGLATLLAREYGERLGEEGRTLLGHVEASAASMAALVNHLVEFARMGTAPHRPMPMELRLVVDQACTNLSSQIAASRARIQIDPEWPTLQCDPVSICQVFQNLIGNAAKFMGSQPDPRVHVGCRPRDHEWEIFVRDNGVGIPPNKHGEIFRLFARLGQVQADGLGVGLSTAEKIVKRHGGRIWVQSAIGKGSTFYFTLPAAEGSGFAVQGSGVGPESSGTGSARRLNPEP